MANLIAKSPASGLLPLHVGSVDISEAIPGAITSIAPFTGQEDAVSNLLVAEVGAPLPPVGGRATGDGVEVLWAGAGQAFVLGQRPGHIPGCAMTDQSDAWTCIDVTGADATAVLARLVPIDLRDSRFGIGDVARTLMGHMTCLLTRTGDDRYRVFVFRSMAGTAVHELDTAARHVAARAALRA